MVLIGCAPSAVLAQGGAGGTSLQGSAGGAGGIDGVAGTNGQSGSTDGGGGGGGGAGAAGGKGGDTTDDPGGIGGPAGTAGGGRGVDGENGVVAAGGGGGGGGGDGATVSSGTLGSSSGGNGGSGGFGGGGGGGGGGGRGVVVTGNPSSTVLSGTVVTAGHGGDGGGAIGTGGSGGAGGTGAQLQGSLVNSGSASGGFGGNGGGSNVSNGGSGGAGGAGVLTNSELTNDGTIAAGSGGNGGNASTLDASLNGTGGSGGAGGAGARLTAPNARFFNNAPGTITGGSGGGSGAGSGTNAGSTGGAGGAGIQTATTIAGGFNSGTVTGGAGADGGVGGASGGSGGGGGAGGAGMLFGGAVFITPVGITNTGTVTGGSGGRGAAGSGGGAGGNGGAGGVGMQFSASAAVENTGTITGGAGGTLRAGSTGTAGAGGAGIAGQDLTILNSGSIIGGLGGDGVTRANAVTFTGGTNVLELQAGFQITGNAVAASAADTLRFGGATNASFDVSAIGAGQQYQGFGVLAKSGGSTWTLSGTTATSAGWQINSGLINFSSAGNLGSGNITLNGGGLQWATGNTLDISPRLTAIGTFGGIFDTNGNDVSLASDLSGGRLTKTGSGTLTLAGNNSLDGATLSGGTVSISTDGNLGLPSGSLSFAGGTLRTTADVAMSRAMFVSPAGGVFNTDANTTLTLNGQFIEIASGSHVVTKIGAGTLVLTNTSNGSRPIDTAINGGTLSISSSSNLGGGALGLDGGTLLTTATLAMSRVVTLGSAGGAFSTDAATTLTLNGKITGGGGLTKTGDGTLRLTSGASDYSGGTTVDAGTLEITNGNALGTGAVTLTGGTLRGAATLSLSSPGLTVAGGAVATIAAAASTTLALNGALVTLSSDSTTTFGGASDTGIVVLASAASAIGTNASLVVAGGTLRAGSGALGTLTGGAANTTVDAGATLDLNGFDTTIGNLQGAGTVATGTDASRRLTLIAGEFSGGITGASGIAKTGAGTMILSGTSDYTGGTTISQGTLQLGVAGGGTGKIVGAVTVDGTFDLINADTTGITGITTNSGGFTNFYGTTTASGTTIVTNDGGQTSFTANSSAGSANITVRGLNGYTFFQDNSTAANATITVTDSATVQFLQNAVAGSAHITADHGGVTFYNASGAAGSTLSAINNGALAFADTSTASTAIVTVSGFGSDLTFYDSSTAASAALTVGNGGIIEFQQSSTAGTSIITVNDGGTVRFFDTTSGGTARFISNAGGTVDFSGLSFSGTTAGSIEGAGRYRIDNRRLTVGSNGLSTEVSGVISGAGGSLVKVGSGTLILTGANTYSGGTTVSAGVLQGNSTSLRGNILDNASVVFDQASTGTYSGVMSGSGSLTKLGAGTLIMTGANSYGGGTTVTAGTLQGNTTSLQGNILNNAAVTFNQATTGTYAGVMSGSGSLTKTGAGTLILSGANSYGGGTTVSAGTLQGTTGSLQGNILNNAAVTFDQAGNGTYAGTMSGSGSLTLQGGGIITLTGTNSYGGGTTVSAGGLIGTTASVQGNIVNNAAVTFDQAGNGTYAGTMSGSGSLTKLGAGTLILSGANTYGGGTTVSAGVLQGTTTGLRGNIVNNAAVIFSQGIDGTYAGAMSGTGGLTVSGGFQLTLTGANSYGGGTTVDNGSGLVGTTTSLQGNIVVNGSLRFDQAADGTYAGNLSGTGSLGLRGGGVFTLTGTNTQGGGIDVANSTVSVASDANLGGAGASLGLLDSTLRTTASFTASRNALLLATGGTFDTAAGTILTWNGAIGGLGGLTKTGAGTLILGSGSNIYSGGTTVSAGVLQGTTSSLQGNIVDNASVVFNQAGNGTYGGNLSGTGSVTVQGGGAVTFSGTNSYSGGTSLLAGSLIGNSQSLQGAILNNAAVIFQQVGTGTYAGAMSGTGSMTLQGGGTLIVTGANTYSGGTTVDASTLVVNGSVAGLLTLNNGGALKGGGSVGTVIANGGTLAPGNSIGTLTVNGNLTQNGTTYQVEANNLGQADRINVGGSAAIQGNSVVQVLAAPGAYARNTTYTILSANGGVTGTYSSVTSNFAFLLPRLSYNANNVFLTLLLTPSAFGSGAQTPNQNSVGQALDRSNISASGDFNDVLNAIAGLSAQQGPAALDTISGQPYANFGTLNVQNGMLFLNAFSQQLAGFHGGSSAGQRLALAEACETESCEPKGPWSVWASAIGGLGSVHGNGNASTFTYNLGGAAAGIDYRIDSRLLVGLGAGYTTGSQWTSAFMGRGWSDSIAVMAYGSFVQSGFYADLLAGYAYSSNQLQRQIAIPGLQARTANGNTGANQFLGQVETGYKLGLYAPAAATLTPFARLQGATISQSGLSEWGSAQSLNLFVAPQTTNALRTTLGADIAGSIGLGDARTLGLELRLGWQHELADTSRLMTAAFAGAPSNGFTIYGATPQRDSAVIGFAAKTAVAEATQIYLRYTGELGTGADNHTLNVGLRMNW